MKPGEQSAVRQNLEFANRADSGPGMTGEIRLLSTTAMKTAPDELAPQFEHATGYHIAASVLRIVSRLVLLRVAELHALSSRPLGQAAGGERLRLRLCGEASGGLFILAGQRFDVICALAAEPR